MSHTKPTSVDGRPIQKPGRKPWASHQSSAALPNHRHAVSLLEQQATPEEVDDSRGFVIARRREHGRLLEAYTYPGSGHET